MTLWRPIDDALAAVATLAGDTTDHQRVRDAAVELDAAARQTVAAALRARKLVRVLPHPEWPVAKLAGRNALEWRDRGYPTGGSGGGSSDHRDLGDVIVKPDEPARLWWDAHQRSLEARTAVAKLRRGGSTRHECQAAWRAISGLHALMLEAAGLTGGPAPAMLNDNGTGQCWNHRRHGAVWPADVTHAGQDVCRWCRDQHDGWGDWPPGEVVEDHDRGGRVAIAAWRRGREAAAESNGDTVKAKKPRALVDAQGRTARGAYAEALKKSAASA